MWPIVETIESTTKIGLFLVSFRTRDLLVWCAYLLWLFCSRFLYLLVWLSDCEFGRLLVPPWEKVLTDVVYSGRRWAIAWSKGHSHWWRLGVFGTSEGRAARGKNWRISQSWTAHPPFVFDELTLTLLFFSHLLMEIDVIYIFFQFYFWFFRFV